MSMLGEEGGNNIPAEISFESQAMGDVSGLALMR